MIGVLNDQRATRVAARGRHRTRSESREPSRPLLVGDDPSEVSQSHATEG
jgi:hypothetical protein